MQSRKEPSDFENFYNKKNGVLELRAKLITDADMPNLLLYLDAHPEIQAVDLSNNNIGDAGVEILSNNKTIKQLDLERTQLSDKGIYFVSLIEQIEHLNVSSNFRPIHNTFLGPLSGQYLSNLPRLKVLKININHLGNEGITHLAKSNSVEHLEISRNKIGAYDTEVFSNNKTIKQLDLSHNNLSDQDIYHISLMKQLKYLNVGNSVPKLGPLSAKHLYNHPQINVLIIKANNLGSEGATYLAKSKNIKCLDISQNNLGNVGAEPFIENTSIHTLHLNRNGITSFDPSKMSKNTIIRHLYLNNNRVDDTATIALTTMPQLETLSLQANPTINERGIKALMTSTTLKTLDFGYNNLTERSSKALISNTTLDYLGLENCVYAPFLNYQILSTEDPMLCANYGKEVGLKSEIPSLKMLSLFAVKKTGLCGYQYFFGMPPTNDKLKLLQHSYYILTVNELYFYNGFQKKLECIPLTPVKHQRLRTVMSTKSNGYISDDELYKHREQLSTKQLQSISKITKHNPPINIVSELGITKTPVVKYF